MNNLNILSNDLIDMILDISTDDIDNKISLLEYKIKKSKDLLEPLYYDSEEFEEEGEILRPIKYEYILCCFNNLFDRRIYEDNIIFVNKKVYQGEGNDYISKKYNNPSYFDILVEANKSVKQTGEYRYSYLREVFKINNENVFEYIGIVPKNNYNYYDFVLGD